MILGTFAHNMMPNTISMPMATQPVAFSPSAVGSAPSAKIVNSIFYLLQQALRKLP